jgi:hypothetical protein
MLSAHETDLLAALLAKLGNRCTVETDDLDGVVTVSLRFELGHVDDLDPNDLPAILAREVKGVREALDTGDDYVSQIAHGWNLAKGMV